MSHLYGHDGLVREIHTSLHVRLGRLNQMRRVVPGLAISLQSHLIFVQVTILGCGDDFTAADNCLLYAHVLDPVLLVD